MSYTAALAFLTLLVALFAPPLAPLGILHVSLAPLAGLAVVLLGNGRFSATDLIVLSAPCAQALLNSLLAHHLYDFPIAIGALWAFFPLFVFVLSYMCGHKIHFELKHIFWVLYGTMIVFNFFVIYQYFYPTSPLLSSYVSGHRRGILERYVLIMAPIGNPNNLALVSLFLVLYCQYILSKVNRHGDAISIIHKVIFVSMLLSAIFFSLFSYARTVFAAFILAQIYILITRLPALARMKAGRLLKVGVAALALAGVGAYLLVDADRQLTYYATTLDLSGQESFLERIETWRRVLGLLIAHPLLLFTGAGWYEGQLQAMQGQTVIDSSIVYMLLAHGLVVTLALVLWLGRLAWRLPATRPFIILLAVSAVTLPFISDYRLGLLLGLALGSVVRLETERAAAPPLLERRGVRHAAAAPRRRAEPGPIQGGRMAGW